MEEKEQLEKRCEQMMKAIGEKEATLSVGMHFRIVNNAYVQTVMDEKDALEREKVCWIDLSFRIQRELQEQMQQKQEQMVCDAHCVMKELDYLQTTLEGDLKTRYAHAEESFTNLVNNKKPDCEV